MFSKKPARLALILLLPVATLAGEPRLNNPPSTPQPLALSAVPVIEPARTQDINGLMEVERASFERSERWPKREWAAALADPKQSIRVIRDGDRIAASILYYLEHALGEPNLYIASLGVHPDYRKRGFGEALTKQALADAMARGAASAGLHVRADNEPAIKLYRKLGFQARRRLPNYYGEGADAFFMDSRLQPR